MISMKSFKTIFSLILLFLGLIGYYIFAFIAISAYPGGFDILNDLWTHLRWYGYNPDGALFFRIGNIIYAISLILFFIGFNKWQIEGKKRQLLIVTAQIDGFTVGLLMVISEIFADIDEIFFITSGLSLLLMVFYLILIIFSLYHHPKFWRPLIFFFVVTIGFTVYILYLGITNTLIVQFRIIDFIVISSNQVAICLIAMNMVKI